MSNVGNKTLFNTFFNYVFKYSHPLFSSFRYSKMENEAISLDYEQDIEKHRLKKIYIERFLFKWISN
jgi:hypothetical protein